jgi:hypothetical protein
MPKSGQQPVCNGAADQISRRSITCAGNEAIPRVGFIFVLGHLYVGATAAVVALSRFLL